jgi:hypothetical protein
LELFRGNFDAGACIGKVLSSAPQQLATGVSALAYHQGNLIIVTIKDLSQK